jgi:phage terminase small subunit
MPKLNGLSPKQQLFIKEYLIDRNATQAAIRAGYAKSSARQIGDKNMSNGAIRKVIDASMETLLNSLDITAARNLKERARLAYYDTGDLAKAKITCPADIAKLPYDLRQAITGWKWDSKGNFVIEVADKNAHLSALDKHLGIYEVDNKQKADPLTALLASLAGNVVGVVKTENED